MDTKTIAARAVPMNNRESLEEYRYLVGNARGAWQKYCDPVGLTSAQVLHYKTEYDTLVRLEKMRNDIPNAVTQEKQKDWLAAIECEELNQARTEARAFVDNLEAYWRSTSSPASQVADSLESQSTQFQKASSTHFWSSVVAAGFLLVVLLFSACLIYKLFISPPISEPAATTAAVWERIALVSVGKLAILALIAWALQFLAKLHRTHAEQSVIYRDRWAALQVASSILRGSQLQQEKDLLTRIIRSYLNFSQNAFHTERIDTERAERKTIKTVREIAKSLAPSTPGKKV